MSKSTLDLALKAQRSRHPYIRALGRCLMGRGSVEQIVKTYTRIGFMPSQQMMVYNLESHFDPIDFVIKNSNYTFVDGKFRKGGQ